MYEMYERRAYRLELTVEFSIRAEKINIFINKCKAACVHYLRSVNCLLQVVKSIGGPPPPLGRAVNYSYLYVIVTYNNLCIVRFIPHPPKIQFLRGRIDEPLLRQAGDQDLWGR
jgi:hypothetical protein